ncbi:putative ATP-dependent Lon protease [Escherichia coli]|uniref:Putative ATP-dependent Lon protease n=1 Tax=Escherichia coli TaxID=562 RepID=A0A376RPW3_ECOLX|nr:putative ATP-dependent Lon protease [Escherichia coli]
MFDIAGKTGAGADGGVGSMTLGGVINPVQDLAASLQLAFDSGAKRVLLPMSSAMDIPTVPAELFTKFQVSFYSDPG